MRSGYEVFRGKDDDWYWRLVAANGEIVAHSEAYTSEDHAYRGTADNSRVVLEATYMKPLVVTVPNDG